MVAIAIYIRLQLQDADLPGIKPGGSRDESLARGLLESERQVRPDRERRRHWRRSRVVQRAVLAYYVLQQVMKPDVLNPALINGCCAAHRAPSMIFFGWLSDKIGRKPIILTASRSIPDVLSAGTPRWARPPTRPTSTPVGDPDRRGHGCYVGWCRSDRRVLAILPARSATRPSPCVSHRNGWAEDWCGDHDGSVRVHA